MTEQLTITPLDPDTHAEALYTLLDKVWEGSGFVYREGRIAHSHYDWQTSRIGFLGETLVTHYGIYDVTMRIGTAQVRCGGVNLVATDPDYRRQGYMHQTTVACMDAMRTAGYDISVLCNAIPDFYVPYGYVFGWPEMSHTLDKADIPHLDRDITLESVKLQHQGEQLLAETSALFNAENEGVTGSAVRPTYHRGKIPVSDDQLYYWRDQQGNLKGYLTGDIHTGRNLFWQEDCAGDPDDILQAWTVILEKTGCEGVHIDRLSEQSALGKRLRHLTCKVQAYYQKQGGFMLTIINLQSLFEKLVPELSRRVQHSLARDWSGTLSITCKDETVTLSINQGQVQVIPTEATDHTVQGGDEIAQLVIGAATPNEVVTQGDISLTGDAVMLIEVLFPKQYAQMNNGDL